MNSRIVAEALDDVVVNGGSGDGGGGVEQHHVATDSAPRVSVLAGYREMQRRQELVERVDFAPGNDRERAIEGTV